MLITHSHYEVLRESLLKYFRIGFWQFVLILFQNRTAILRGFSDCSSEDTRVRNGSA